MADLRVYIRPRFEGPDNGEGGIRRVVEAQRRYLPAYGVEVVDSEEQADLVAVHAGDLVNTRKPLVAHCHGLYNTADQEWSKWAWQLNAHVLEALRRATLATVPSRWVGMQVARGLNLDARVWYAGVEPADWEPGENQGYVLWNKTRVDPVCDPTAVDVLARRNPDLPFVTTFGGRANNVTVTGKLSFARAREVVKNAAVYLATSRETFGIATIEAMAAGVPVLGWGFGGQLDIVEHEVTGYLAKPGDWDDLQAGLAFCLAHRDELGAAGRALALERFTWTRAMSECADLYREALGLRGTGPRTSIVVTNYKLEEYLGDLLQSVQGQTDPDWECLIVDDCSPVDEQRNCADLVAEYSEGDSRIRYLRTPRNLYLAGARNYGIAQSHGRYVLPLDADDMLAPRALEVLANHLDREPGHAIAYAAMEVLEPDGRRWVSSWPGSFVWERQLAHHNQLPYASLYRREVWRRTGGYRERCRTAEDADFWCRVTSFGFRAAKVSDYPALIKRERADSMGHVEWDPDWTGWFGWSKQPSVTPFAAPGTPPNGMSWPVKTFAEPKVSVVIPVGPGHERLVHDALDSLQAQTEDDWEAVVANDTGAPLDLAGYPWARVVDLEGAGNGPARARNAGIAQARGELIVCLDADDYLMPRYLERVLGAYDGGFVYTDWWQVGQDGQGERKESKDFAPLTLLYEGLPWTMNSLFPRKAWEAAGGFDPASGGWEDWDFFFHLATLGYCGTRVAEPLFAYRYWSGQRREDGYAQREQNARALRAKWGRYIDDGGKALAMACGTCGGKKRAETTTLAQVTSLEASMAQAAASGMVLIEYVGASVGTRTYRGPSGQTYRFGANDSHRRGYMWQQDVSHFLRLSEFRAVVAEQKPAAPATELLDMRQSNRVGD